MRSQKKSVNQIRNPGDYAFPNFQHNLVTSRSSCPPHMTRTSAAPLGPELIPQFRGQHSVRPGASLPQLGRSVLVARTRRAVAPRRAATPHPHMGRACVCTKFPLHETLPCTISTLGMVAPDVLDTSNPGDMCRPHVFTMPPRIRCIWNHCVARFAAIRLSTMPRPQGHAETDVHHTLWRTSRGSKTHPSLAHYNCYFGNRASSENYV